MVIEGPIHGAYALKISFECGQNIISKMLGRPTNDPEDICDGVGEILNMVVGLVNSGFMTLTQALGVIFGANIGTTITGWILVLEVGKYGLLVLGLAAFVFMFSKKEKIRYTAMTIMGIGMIFFGLELMKNGLKPIAELEQFKTVFSWFEAKCMFDILVIAWRTGSSTPP